MTTEQKYIVALDQGTTSSRAVVLIKMPISFVALSVNLPKFIQNQDGLSTILSKFMQLKARP